MNIHASRLATLTFGTLLVLESAPTSIGGDSAFEEQKVAGGEVSGQLSLEERMILANIVGVISGIGQSSALAALEASTGGGSHRGISSAAVSQGQEKQERELSASNAEKAKAEKAAAERRAREIRQRQERQEEARRDRQRELAKQKQAAEASQNRAAAQRIEREQRDAERVATAKRAEEERERKEAEEQERAAAARLASVEAEMGGVGTTSGSQLWNGSVELGWMSDYYFRGLNIARRVAFEADSPFAQTKARFNVGNFSFSAGYVQSLDKLTPRGSGLRPGGDVDGHLSEGDRGAFGKSLSFREVVPDRYQEINLNAGYSIGLGKMENGGPLFSITPGISYTHINNGTFWGTEEDPIEWTAEVGASLSYYGLSDLGLYPTLTYAYDIEGFPGGYLEAGLAYRIPLLNNENGLFPKLSLWPSVRASYDFSYNGLNDGWNNVEFGLKIPVHLTPHISLFGNVGYAIDAGSPSAGKRRTDDGFSASIMLSIHDISTINDEPAPTGPVGKGKVPVPSIVESPGPWKFSVGAGFRTIDADFNILGAGRAPNLGVYSTVPQGEDVGSLRDASMTSGKVTYADGSVTPTVGSKGTGEVVIKSVKQIDGRRTTEQEAQSDFENQEKAGYTRKSQPNRSAVFHSERYYYSENDLSRSQVSSDSDSPVYPYARLEREVYRDGSFSVSAGFGYSYTRAELNHGAQFAGLQSINEQHDTHRFVYDFDEASSVDTPEDGSKKYSFDSSQANWGVIIDSGDYYGKNDDGSPKFDQAPQHDIQQVNQEVRRIAAFRSAELDVSMHTLEIPLSATWDITNRLHAAISVGPTLSIFQTRLTTETFYQDLNTDTSLFSANALNSFKKRFGARYTGGDLDFGEIYPPGRARDGEIIKIGNSYGLSAEAGRSANGAAVSAPAGPSSQPAVQGQAGGKGNDPDVSRRRLPGRTVDYTSHTERETHFQFGAFAQGTLIYDFDDRRRWYLEVFGRYDYISPLTVDNGEATVEIDPTSFSVGLGLGYRF